MKKLILLCSVFVLTLSSFGIEKKVDKANSCLIIIRYRCLNGDTGTFYANEGISQADANRIATFICRSNREN